MTKDEIRTVMKQKRRMLTEDKVSQSGKAIAELAFSLDCIKNAQVIMSYFSAFKEPDSDYILRRIFESGKKAAVPVSNTETFDITPSFITPSSSVISGAYGIREPETVTEVQINEIDAVFIPGIAFSRSGDRLGFGKGYYDRFLSHLGGVKIGVCYDFQMLDTLPRSPHDIKMDIIITEKRIYNDF